MEIKKTIKQWMLPIAMLTGASIYLIYHILPEPVHHLGPFLSDALGLIQPLLIFSMLFLTFCTIEPKDLKPHRWHWWLLLVQGGVFAVLALIALAVMKLFPERSGDLVVLIESAMLCFICPTATAAAVVTRKLGGDVPGITTYIVLINILTALMVPVVIPLIVPEGSLGFWVSFGMIVAKVFPLLITPCLCAWLIRYLAPKLHRKLLSYPDLAFYLWSVALTLAIAVTTKSIVHSTMSVGLILAMSLVSLICCAIQFALGRHIGASYRPRLRNLPVAHAPVFSAHTQAAASHPQVASHPHAAASHPQTASHPHAAAIEKGRAVRKVTAGQSLGQKNTVFAIWLAYTFLTPETAIVGGLYSIWHNIYNSWQLRHQAK